MNSVSFLNDIRGRNILVCPLNWGLGHASRSITIIKSLIERNSLFLASDGLALNLLRNEFPELPYAVLPGYDISYKGRGGFFMWDMFRQVPKVGLAVSQEMAIMDELVKKHGIDIIISDHRLGCRSDLCKSYIIAHQLNIKDDSGYIGAIGTKMNKYFINQFDECWIPDYSNRQMSLAGDLSVPEGLKSYRFIGPLTRIRQKQMPELYDVLVILSGPEPARSRTEELLIEVLSPHAYRIAFVRGTTKAPKTPLSFSKILDMASSKECNLLMNQSKVVISRSGYSTIMDLEVLDKKCILIPTPGQTEQEYLAQHLSGRYHLRVLKERDLTPVTIGQAIQEMLST